MSPTTTWISCLRAAMRATAAPPRGFDIATSIGTDGQRPAFYGSRAAQASEAGRILSSVPGADESPRRQSGASQTHGGRVGRPRCRRRGLGGHGPAIALHGWHGRNGNGPRPDRVLATTWVVMMAAMMLPSAIPVVLEFART